MTYFTPAANFLLGLLLFCSGNAMAMDASSDVTSGKLIQIAVSLILIALVAVGGTVLLKKLGVNRLSNSFPVKVIGAVAIGPNQRIMVIEVEDKWIVLGVTPHQISTITDFPRQESAGDFGAGVKPNLPVWLQNTVDKFQGK